MRKYAVSLDPVQVGRMREQARQTAAREGRDVTWVALVRELMDAFLDMADKTAAATTNGGGR